MNKVFFFIFILFYFQNQFLLREHVSSFFPSHRLGVAWINFTSSCQVKIFIRYKTGKQREFVDSSTDGGPQQQRSMAAPLGLRSSTSLKRSLKV